MGFINFLLRELKKFKEPKKLREHKKLKEPKKVNYKPSTFCPWVSELGNSIQAMTKSFCGPSTSC